VYLSRSVAPVGPVARRRPRVQRAESFERRLHEARPTLRRRSAARTTWQADSNMREIDCRSNSDKSEANKFTKSQRRLGWPTGFEPATTRSTIWGSNQAELRPPIKGHGPQASGLQLERQASDATPTWCRSGTHVPPVSTRAASHSSLSSIRLVTGTRSGRPHYRAARTRRPAAGRPKRRWQRPPLSFVSILPATLLKTRNMA
jgi:hypothetical protein